MSAPSASTSSRAASGSTRTSGLLRGGHGPAHRVFFVHARQLHHAAVLAQRLGQPLEAVLVVHLHAPRVGGDAQKVGDKDQQRLRVGRAEIAIQRRELVLLGAARVKLAHVAHKDHLERRHQRRRLRAVQHFEDRCSGQVEIGEAEIPQIRRHKGLEHGGAAAVQQKDLVAGQHVTGLERPAAGCGSLNLRHKAAHGAESRAPARAAQLATLPDASRVDESNDHAAPEYLQRATPSGQRGNQLQSAMPAPIRYSASVADRCRSQPFQHIGHQLPRKLARKPLHGRRVFLEETSAGRWWTGTAGGRRSSCFRREPCRPARSA